MIPIRKILIANRGEIARRIQRTCRDMGIATVAIYSDPDRRAPFVREADEAVYIGAPVTGSSFLAIDTILDAAQRLGVDAIHPGYGFLAENADFAQACADRGVIFIGPSPDTIRRMGSKLGAKEIAAQAGVASVPGLAVAGFTPKQLAKQVEALGFPVLIKASAGGGGKGMRIVESTAALDAAVAAAAREAQSAFGDATLLIERYITSPRHIEIQILGDQHGQLIHLFERECSIQRRYQKIIEEAPSPAVTPELRRRMGEAALSLARTLGYCSAGTVEFVVDTNGEFYFLEVNTRLQVEHPVTEAVTGLDLVRLQIEIAAGRPLGLKQEDIPLKGHAIEARVCAEDPQNNYLPSIGHIHCWDAPQLQGVRWESGVESGSEVTIHYDPMLAKVIAHGATRDEAAQRLSTALGKLRLHGVRSNLALLRNILSHKAFLAAELDTHFLDRHAASLAPADDTATIRAHALAATLWSQAQRRDDAPVLASLPSGWRNNRSSMQESELRLDSQDIVVRYAVGARGQAQVSIGDWTPTVTIVAVDSATIVLEIDALQRSYRVMQVGDALYVHSGLGSSDLHQLPRFPENAAADAAGGCTAPMPGKVIAVRVAVGDNVVKGDALVILEAMKMEHTLTAPGPGTIDEVRVVVGQQVDAGAVLLVIRDTLNEGEKSA